MELREPYIEKTHIATNFRNGTIAARLQEFNYLLAEGGIIKHKATDVR
jgi:hypothetical protein